MKNKELLNKIHQQCMGMYNEDETRNLAESIISLIQNNLTPKTIYIDVQGGNVQAIYGDRLDTDEQIMFVVRDHDNISMGDKDPIPEGKYQPEVHYW